jgi:O-antigen ligase
MPNNVTLAPVTAPPTAAVPCSLPEPDPHALGRRRPDLALSTVVVACAWWLVAAPRFWGGRSAGAVTVGAILTALALLAIQPQRYLPARAIWSALAVSASALGVAALAPTGWGGAATAASYVCVSWTVVAVAAAVVRNARVVNLLLLLVVVGVLVEVGESWLAWWGGADAGRPIIGTFYWYDPFAAFLVAGTLIALSLWLRRRGPVAALGLVTFTLGTVGLVYSTSRAAGACFALGVVVVFVAQLIANGRLGVLRALVAVAVMAGSVWAISGPPFFAHRVTPFGGTAARASGQSLGQNGRYRVDFWREALGVFDRHPITGGGFHSLATESAGHVPHSWPLSPLAHNGYLQVLSDGGLLLGLPFLIVALGVMWWVVSSLAAAIRRRDSSTLGLAVPLGLGALLAHSAVDFDWSYAADFLVVAVLTGLLAGARWRSLPSSTTGPRPVSRWLTGAVAVGVILTGIAAVAARSGDLRQSLPTAHPASIGVSQ